MTERKIQIVAFNNPYPPDFGGAIDLFYKIKALNALGIKIYLHFFYNDREDISKLKNYCVKIYKYKQKRKFFNHFSLKPFSTKSRESNLLYDRLKAENSPILLESLRCCALLSKKKLTQRTAVRCHNIEHYYSWGLAKSEKNLIFKMTQYIEGLKQKSFQSVLNKADIIFSISMFEQDYFIKRFRARSIFLPVFHGHQNISSLDGFGKYALYHGDLSTADNVKSVLFLVDVFKNLSEPLVIASSRENTRIMSVISKYDTITFRLIRSNQDLDDLIKNAHINTLYSYQRSGTKLKVFNALFNGRHCIVNENIADDPNILSICNIANTKEDYQEKVTDLFKKEFKISEDRVSALKTYNDIDNAKIIIDNLF